MLTPAAIVACSVMGMALSNPLVARQAGYGDTDITLYPSGDCQGTPLDTILIGGSQKCYAFDQQAASVRLTTSLQSGAPGGTYMYKVAVWSDKVCTAQAAEGRTLQSNAGTCYNVVANAVSVEVDYTA